MLRGTNVKLRALEPADLELLYQWENDHNNWLISGTLVPFSKYLLKEYLERSHHDIYTLKQLRLIIDCMDNGKVKSVGCIDLFDFDPKNKRAGVGILIANVSDRNKGYASDALQVLVKYAFNTLDLHQLYCNITDDNEGSMQLFTKQGFDVVGLKKDWIYNNGHWLGEYTLQKLNK